MGWRFTWWLSIESDRDPGDVRWPTLVKWAIVGLAIIGISGILIAKGVVK